MNTHHTIEHVLAQNQPLCFAEFMQKALYDPHVGYYSRARPIGRQGDFITAPELTPLFGQTLARQCEQILLPMEKGHILEFGAGSGRLCIDVLRALEARDALPERYSILEVSGSLKAWQKENIAQEIPHLMSHIEWLCELPTEGFSGVMLANEVLDAMPVHRFIQTESGILESHVSLDAAQKPYEHFLPCQNPRLLAYLANALPKEFFPYQSEANLFLDGFLKQCSASLVKGAFFIIDYGFPRHEYYHPDRRQGTLMCHYQHHAHPNPLIHIGEQDITAHVDFTHVAEAGYDAGFHVAGFTNQASFLLANGLLSLLGNMGDSASRFSEQQAVKQLIQPNEMGELFKVIALTKGIDEPLEGFQLHDKRKSL